LRHTHPPALIVWPETSGPGLWREVERESADAPRDPDPRSLHVANEIVRAFPAYHLLGMNTEEVSRGGDGSRDFNSAILISPGGRRVLDRYDKLHRVAFGEYIPFKSWLPFLKWFNPYEGADYGISPGRGLTRFEIPGGTFGVLICYEDTVPDIARAYAGVDFLVNISNDGWFDGTSQHDQHLATARFRAVETRRPLVRAVNMGISAVIDADGRVLTPVQEHPGLGVWVVPPEHRRSMPPAEWGRFKKVSCVIVAHVPLDGRHSVYAQVGDVLALSVCAVLGLLLLASRWGKPAAPEPPAEDSLTTDNAGGGGHVIALKQTPPE
jgi:apolipoprotein N-acyltransferase